MGDVIGYIIFFAHSRILTTKGTKKHENLMLIALTDKPASENFAWDLSTG